MNSANHTRARAFVQFDRVVVSVSVPYISKTVKVLPGCEWRLRRPGAVGGGWGGGYIYISWVRAPKAQPGSLKF